MRNDEQNPGQAALEKSATGWRGSKWLAVCELAVVALIFAADQWHFIPLSKTPFLLALGWISLRLRKVGWREIGFKMNRSWGITLALGVAAGTAMETFQLLVTQPLLTQLTGTPPDVSDFQAITGNVKIALIVVALAWTLAAFGEEMVWRGYLMNRVADVGKRTRAAWIVSFITVNIVFGCAHANQGLTGIIEESIAGMLLGIAYLSTGRNLAVPIIAHGMQDTIDVVLIFFGKFPGM